MKKIEQVEFNEAAYSDTPEEDRYELIRDYIWQEQRILKYDDEVILEYLPTSLGDIYLIIMLEAEVNNGGFHQYFMNSSGRYAEKALRALEKIKANKTGQLLSTAMNYFNQSNINHKDLRLKVDELKQYQRVSSREVLNDDELYKKLNELDDKFYRSSEDTYGLMMNYFERNQDQVWRKIGSSK